MARYTISVGLTDGTREEIDDLGFSRREDAIRVARHLAADPSADATDYYVDDETGACVWHIRARRAA